MSADDQASLFDGPDEHRGRVRTEDPATSHAGARDVVYRAGSQKAQLLVAYRAAYPGGLTDEEAAKVTGLFDRPSACWWKRSNELRQDGYIEWTGETRNGIAGTPRMVCRAKEGA